MDEMVLHFFGDLPAAIRFLLGPLLADSGRGGADAALCFAGRGFDNALSGTNGHGVLLASSPIRAAAMRAA